MINQQTEVAYNQALLNAQTNNLLANQIAYDQALIQKAAQDQALLQMMQTRNIMTQPVIINPVAISPMQIGDPNGQNQSVAKPDDSCQKSTLSIMSICMVIGGIYLWYNITNSQMFQAFSYLQPYASDISEVPYVDTCGQFISYNYATIYFSYISIAVGIIGFLLYYRMPLGTVLLGVAYTGTNYYMNGQAASGDCAEVWDYVKDALSYINVDAPDAISFYYMDMFYAGLVYTITILLISRMKK